MSYSGTALAATVSRTLAQGQYHWQARVKDTAGAYSAWVSFGSGNAETARDLGIDTVAPATGSVYDGSTTDVDAAFNDGSLTTLSANWSGFSDALAGIASYSYAIGTTPGGTNILGATSTGTGTTAAPTGLSLATSTTYYVSVVATDNAGNVTTTVSSDGQQVAPTLTFSRSGVGSGVSCGDVTTTVDAPLGGMDLGRLTSTSQHAIGGRILEVSTNAALGYTVTASYATPMTGTNTAHLMAAVPGTNATPLAWPAAGTEAFGYTTSSRTLSGDGSRFAGGLWAALTATPAEVMRRSSPAVTTDSTCIAFGASRAGNTPSDVYAALIRLTATPVF